MIVGILSLAIWNKLDVRLGCHEDHSMISNGDHEDILKAVYVGIEVIKYHYILLCTSVTGSYVLC